MPRTIASSRIATTTACLIAFHVAPAGASCDLALPRFDPTAATARTVSPSMTRIPRNIAVEHAGFPTPDAAARCFGARYHDQRAAEYVTFIVPVGGGWGYLTPGKGGRGSKRVQVADLQHAAQDAGHALHALAHTHPYGASHFSRTDVTSALKSNGMLYVTNWRNETFRTDAAGIRSYMRAVGLGTTRAALDRFLDRLDSGGDQGGFPGKRVD